MASAERAKKLILEEKSQAELKWKAEKEQRKEAAIDRRERVKERLEQLKIKKEVQKK